MPIQSCPTIKANARLRRSRKWKDALNEKNNNDENANSANRSPKKNTRRRRRPSKKEASPVSDCDTASTASTDLPSDDSLSGHSGNGALGKSPSKQRNAKQQRRKRTKKSKSPPKNLHIQADLTPEQKSRYVALDAEMVGVGVGGLYSRLARVSLVDWEGEVIYDVHVRVEEAVTDYRTFVSGITKEDIEGPDAVSFDEAHSAVSELLEGKILVGHGLKNDFRALGLSHPWHLTRDTARYEPFMRPLDDPMNPPPGTPIGATHVPKKLRVLALQKLGMHIQEEGQPHSPVEDAVAALELYKKHRGKWERAMTYKVEKTRSITAAQ